MSTPERFLEDHGWCATVVQPGDPEAHYERWHFPVVPRILNGIPRRYVVQGARIGIEERARKSAARYQSVRQPGVVGTFACPEGPGPFPAVLALGGSDGGVPEGYLDLLLPQGFACLALAYFGVDGTQLSLVEGPLERERGLRWLATHPKVASRDGRVAVAGVSRGGEFALLAAATFPNLVGPIVAYTPSSVVWPGVDVMQTGGARSSWSHGGHPLPYLPYVDGTRPTLTNGRYSSLDMCNAALDQAAAAQQAQIPIERATGPVLLISGGDDHVWPATRMCRMLVERMRVHGRDAPVTHLDYPFAGHGLFPYRPLPQVSVIGFFAI